MRASLEILSDELIFFKRVAIRRIFEKVPGRQGRARYDEIQPVVFRSRRKEFRATTTSLALPLGRPANKKLTRQHRGMHIYAIVGAPTIFCHRDLEDASDHLRLQGSHESAEIRNYSYIRERHIGPIRGSVGGSTSSIPPRASRLRKTMPPQSLIVQRER